MSRLEVILSWKKVSDVYYNVFDWLSNVVFDINSYEISIYEIPRGDIALLHAIPPPVRQFMLGEINGFIRAFVVTIRV